MWQTKTNFGKILDNSPYPILSANQKSIRMRFIDFKYDYPDVFLKDIDLKTVSIDVADDDVETSIYNHLNLDFVQIIREEAIKQRNKISSISEKFDIDTKKVEEQLDQNKFITDKLNNCSNYISMNGRIGPAQYIITSEKINDYFFDKMGDSMFNRNVIFYIDKNLSDDEIIFGRKNDADQPGVTLVINENSFNNIIYKEEKMKINISYAFTVNGFSPEKQYFLIKIN